MDIIQSGGPVMIPILILSVIFLALVFYSVHLFLFYKNEPRWADRARSLLHGRAPDEVFEIVVYPLLVSILWMNRIAGLSTLLGLLGTVIGIYDAFNALQSAGEADIIVFAGGIREAVITTIAGLIVAVPASISYFLFRDRFMGLHTAMTHRIGLMTLSGAIDGSAEK